uniref:Uncharacterized protein n=1 Tax=Anguilla anguilla TaxID=7936 RepID=A0A0E9TB00_ANGAN
MVLWLDFVTVLSCVLLNLNSHGNFEIQVLSITGGV